MAIASRLTFTGCIGLLLGATAAGAQPGATEPIPVDEESGPPAAAAPVMAAQPRIVHHIGAAPAPQWGGGVRLTGLSGVGALPGVNIGAELAGFVRRDEHFLELAVGHWVPQETYVVSMTPVRVDLALDVWTLRGGWASQTMPLRAWLLAESGELAGQHQVSGAIARMVGAVEKDRRWLAAGAGFGVAWPMSDQARLVGTVELAVPIQRKEMMMQSGSPFEPAAAAARCNLGLEIGWR